MTLKGSPEINLFNAPSNKYGWSHEAVDPDSDRLFDLMSREEAVLASGYQQAGDRRIKFEIRSLTSGVHFYRLETGDGVLTRKMSLVR